MGERWRLAYIALTAVVVALAITSAVYSAGRPPKPTPSATLYATSAMPSEFPAQQRWWRSAN